MVREVLRVREKEGGGWRERESGVSSSLIV